MSSHRADSCSDKDTRKSRAVRLGAVLLAVVGVTAAATSAGFTNDAWFAGSASSANVSLQGKLASDPATEWEDADNEGLAITIPADTFENMVDGETRTVQVDLKNAGSVDLDVAGEVRTRTGTLLMDNTKTTITVAIDDAEQNGTKNLEAKGGTAKATITVTAKNWDATMQNQSAAGDETNGANKLVVDFTGSAIESGK
ncbi:hypothetical protein [Actinomyces sp.]|uniref:hypothetical protein n=1 Tax=Actinomyces sp. TaxID=29317 RepID=UPI00289B2739|nr:hypothetical protein [Actinomyces sp.]